MKTLRAKRRRGLVSTDSAWEAMKDARQNIGHDEAVQQSFQLTQQFYRLWGHTMPTSPVDLRVVLQTLTSKKIPFVLTGAHGIGGWTGRPRSTKDIDILVKGGRNHARAVKAIKELYPELETKDHGGVIAFYVPGDIDSVIDVTFPLRDDQIETLSNPTWTENEAMGLRYRVPSLEEALANKYGAMLTPARASRKRRQDIIDFEYMVQHSMDKGRKPIDLDRLEVLGNKVWPGGGGKEILRLVDEVKAGKAINLDSLG